MRIHWRLSVSFAVAWLAGSVVAAVAQTASQTPSVVFLDQGAGWDATKRVDFYGRDQGSRIMPLDWMEALKQANGLPFLADGLARYGYLPNPANTNGLPVGFVASGPMGAQNVGMTCSACHTRQITVAGTPYRVDGGPAITDFQSFLGDLDTAVGSVVASDAAFAPFAAALLQTTSPAEADVTSLSSAANGWYLRNHTLI